MAGHDENKVFAATPRKRRQAREQGLVVVSPHLVTGFCLLALTAALHFGGQRLFADAGTFLQGSLEQVRPEAFATPADRSAYLMGQLRSSAQYFLARLWPFWLLPLVAIVTVLAQTRGLLHWAAVKPSLDRVNPAHGVLGFAPGQLGRRLFAAAMQLVGLSAIAWIWVDRRHALEAHLDLAHQAHAEFDRAVEFLFVLSLGLVGCGAFDYVFRRWRFEKQLRMSARELAEEQQQFETDPAIGRRAQEMRSRFATAVSLNAETDLLITDGLGSGSLLRFDPQTQSVPEILTRQQDSAGLQLLQRCRHARVPIHVSKELQQVLRESSDRLLPESVWAEVAELFTYRDRAGIVPKSVGEPVYQPRVSSGKAAISGGFHNSE